MGRHVEQVNDLANDGAVWAHHREANKLMDVPGALLVGFVRVDHELDVFGVLGRVAVGNAVKARHPRHPVLAHAHERERASVGRLRLESGAHDEPLLWDISADVERPRRP